MAQYFTDFSEYTIDTAPADWSSEYASFTFDVRAPRYTGSTGAAVLYLDSGAVDPAVLTWDDLDADTDRADCEVVCRFQHSEANLTMGLAVRTQGSDGSETFYRFGAIGTRDGALYKYVAGTRTTIELFSGAAGLDDLNADDGRWYWVRGRVEGTSLKMRSWRDNDPEPDTWDIEQTDSDITGVGGIGVFAGSYQELDYDLFGVGTNGDPAPTSDPDTSTLAVPDNFLFTKTDDTAEVTGSWDSVTDAASYDYEVEEWDGSAWQPFALSSVTAPTTTFTLDDTDGVQFSTLYRARVRAVPAV